jgi:hypothetical protein
MKKNESEGPILWAIFFAILFALLVIAYVVSRGKFTFSKAEVDAELKRKRDDLKEQHRILMEVIRKKEAIRDERIRWCKQVYFVVRLGLVMSGVGIVYLLVSIGLIDSSFGDITSALGAMAFLVIVLGFLLKGKTSLQDIICSIKDSFENILYGKYREIHNEIEFHYEESRLLQEQIDELDKKVSLYQDSQ